MSVLEFSDVTPLETGEIISLLLANSCDASVYDHAPDTAKVLSFILLHLARKKHY